jgi:hypothetical protein
MKLHKNLSLVISFLLLLLWITALSAVSHGASMNSVYQPLTVHNQGNMMLNNVVDTPECNCPKCGHHINKATSVDDKHTSPVEGDVSVCIECSTMLIFNADMTLHIMSREEFYALPLEVRYEIAKAVFAVSAAKVMSQRTH